MAKAPADIRSLCRAYTPEAVRTVAAIMRHKGHPPGARVAAAALLIERGWGKAPQDLTVDGEIKVTIRSVLDIIDAVEASPVLELEKTDSQNGA